MLQSPGIRCDLRPRFLGSRLRDLSNVHDSSLTGKGTLVGHHCRGRKVSGPSSTSGTRWRADSEKGAVLPQSSASPAASARAAFPQSLLLGCHFQKAFPGTSCTQQCPQERELALRGGPSGRERDQDRRSGGVLREPGMRQVTCSNLLCSPPGHHGLPTACAQVCCFNKSPRLFSESSC